MKRILLLIVLFLSSLVLCSCSREERKIGPDAPHDSVPNILGTYVVNGTDNNGRDYGGHLTITPGDNPEEYKFQWILVESIQLGYGILDGNKLQVEWRSIDTSTEPYHGTVLYTVTINGELYGSRTVSGGEGNGTEVAYPNQ